MVKKVLIMTALLGLLPFSAGADLMSGNVAPDFTLTDTTQKIHKLSDFKGKLVVLEWFNTDCPFVKKHYDSGNMQRLQKKYTAQGVVWLSINSSAVGKQGHYTAEEYNLWAKDKDAAPTAILTDHDGKVGQLYGAKTTPHIFIIDENGALVYQGAIDSIASTNAEDIPTAENYVESALNAVMAKKAVANPNTKAYGCSVKY